MLLQYLCITIFDYTVHNTHEVFACVYFSDLNEDLSGEQSSRENGGSASDREQEPASSPEESKPNLCCTPDTSDPTAQVEESCFGLSKSCTDPEPKADNLKYSPEPNILIEGLSGLRISPFQPEGQPTSTGSPEEDLPSPQTSSSGAHSERLRWGPGRSHWDPALQPFYDETRKGSVWELRCSGSPLKWPSLWAPTEFVPGLVFQVVGRFGLPCSRFAALLLRAFCWSYTRPSWLAAPALLPPAASIPPHAEKFIEPWPSRALHAQRRDSVEYHDITAAVSAALTVHPSVLKPLSRSDPQLTAPHQQARRGASNQHPGGELSCHCQTEHVCCRWGVWWKIWLPRLQGPEHFLLTPQRLNSWMEKKHWNMFQMGSWNYTKETPLIKERIEKIYSALLEVLHF